MKVRKGFVSNSSSSSFVIIKEDLYNYPYRSVGEDIKEEARESYLRTIEEWKKRGYFKEKFIPTFTKKEAEDLIQKIYDANENSEEPWFIEEYRDFVLCSTTMTNFDLMDCIVNLLGREIDPIINLPSYCGFNHWAREKGGIQALKTMIDAGFPKEEEK